MISNWFPFISWTKEMHGNAPSISPSFTQEKKVPDLPTPSLRTVTGGKVRFTLPPVVKVTQLGSSASTMGATRTYPGGGMSKHQHVDITRKNWDVIQSMGSIGILGNGENFQDTNRDPWISMNCRVFSVPSFTLWGPHPTVENPFSYPRLSRWWRSPLRWVHEFEEVRGKVLEQVSN